MRIEILEMKEVEGNTIYVTEGNIQVPEVGLLELTRQGYDFFLSYDLEQEIGFVQLEYAEVFHSLDGDDKIDVYIHTVEISHDYGTELSNGGRLVKTYKREASAIKYAEGLGVLEVIVN